MMALGRKTLEDLLAPISKALGHEGVPTSVPTISAASLVPARATDGMGAKELASTFAAEAEKVRVTVHRCTREQAAGVVAAIVSQAPGAVVAARDERLAALGVYDALDAGSLTIWDVPESPDAAVAAARDAAYGITFADGAIAETGTIMQFSSPSCGRSISLLPPTHIALVDAAAIKPTMLECMQELREIGGDAGRGLPDQVCFISGPSVTSDIELVRVEGVHGPMCVHYVLTEGGAADS